MQLFLLPEDERDLSAALRHALPRIVFLDNNVWDGTAPAVAESIAECRSHFAYLWNPDVVSTLPTMIRKDGRLEGPSSGVVIQLARCRLNGAVLLSGDLGVGIGGGDSSSVVAMRKFVDSVWKIVRKAAPITPAAVDPESRRVVRARVPEYHAGRHVAEWLEKDGRRILKARSTENYFVVRTSE